MSTQMARLNEAPVPAENLESFKRKFMRQNRDIARANSNQSLRIRNLENEMSRLLSENLDLREQNLRLQNEIESGDAQQVAAQISLLKSQFETKLLELGELVCGLGTFPAAETMSSKGRRARRTSTSQSPDQKSWKNMCTLSQAVSGQEGKLPTILEDRAFPGRTLDRQEILEVVTDAPIDTTDSPEIGPPPVSQFVDEDPLKINLPLRRKEESEPAVLDPALSANLEHRRKRKDSVVAADLKRPSRLELSQGSQESTKSLKSGAKRKLSVREDDEESEAGGKTQNTSPDNFQFTRVAAEDRTRNKSSDPLQKLGGKVTRKPAALKAASGDTRPTTRDVPTNRKVLAPKSVNDSPRKATQTSKPDALKPAEEAAPKMNLTRDRTKSIKHETVLIEPPNQPVVQTVEVQPEPETPASLDIFSPMSSQPSTIHTELRDTPPPSDLGSGNEAHRPSRRARASVSYAEPNLRDKMRRPTKELVDAVIREDKNHRGSSVKLEDDVAPSNVKIKEEPESEDAWRRMPSAAEATLENSPLRNKGTGSETLSSTITSHRKRRESILAQNDAELSRLGSRNTMAALLAEGKAKVAATEKANNNNSLPAEPAAPLDVYEFKGSSPITEEPAPKLKREGFVASRFSRRLSAVPTDIVGVENDTSTDVVSYRKTPASTTGRRQSLLGIRNGPSGTQVAKEEDKEKMLTKALSTNGIGNTESTVSRNERVSARRSSMML